MVDVSAREPRKGAPGFGRALRPGLSSLSGRGRRAIIYGTTMLASTSPKLGMCFPREMPARFVREVAERLETDGVDQLWVIEDCFYTTAPSLAATALALTTELTVGIGILPAVARNPAVTAMELATLAELAPGRVIAGIGHGVQEWMQQMGARTPSPLTTLEEVLTTVRRLLAGERVTFDGREVHLDQVALDPPPAVAPPVLAGVRGPKSMAVAGRSADGLVLAEGAGPTYVERALDDADRRSGEDFRVSVFTALCLTDDAADAHRLMSPFLASLLSEPSPALDAHPFIDEIRERFSGGGVDALATMPAGWWREIGAIGSLADVVTHVDAMRDAGVDDLSFFPGPTVELTRNDLDAVAAINGAVD